MAVDIELPKFKMPKLRNLPGYSRRKLREYKRVLSITKRPSSDEFKSISKVTGIGMIVVGLTGFIIFMLAQVLV